MGHGAVYDLAHNSPGVSAVTVADFDERAANQVADGVGSAKVTPVRLDVSDGIRTAEIMGDHDAAISCVNYWHNEELSKIAIRTRTSFCDLGGNNYVVDSQLALDEEARNAEVSIIPDCGLAPGMVSLLAMHGAQRFDEIEEIHIRVGGLPQEPEPPLDYQLVFSVEGLINEYIEVARVIRDGKIAEVESMTELESLSFEGFPSLEAFQTSGGTSTLPDSFLGKLKELDYKTIRYTGHCEKFKTMIDLGLCSSDPVDIGGNTVVPRKLFGKLLQEYLPADGPDLVLIRVAFQGLKEGNRSRLNYDIVDRYDEGTGLSAMMRTTSFPASIIAQMMAAGDVKRRGATPQEAAIDPVRFVGELDRRGIVIRENWE